MEQCLPAGMPSHSEAPSGGAGTFWFLLVPFGSFWVLLKGTRRKGATLSSRYRSNG